MYQEELPFRLYANCRMVKGAGRSTICDLQRNKVHLIPNSLYELLIEMEGNTISEIKRSYQNEFDQVIDEYFSFLLSEDLIFHTDLQENFLSLSSEWATPSVITDAILDIDCSTDYDLFSVSQELDSLDCKCVEIRVFDPFAISSIEDFVRVFEETTIISIGLIICFDSSLSFELLSDLCDRYKRITTLTIHGSPFENMLFSSSYVTPISFIPRRLTDSKCCGNISADYFTSYIETFTESLRYNSCLNKKIGIDTKGNIKNCPSMKQIFGLAGRDSIHKIVQEAEFKKIWEVNKELILVCQDCEFRHVCTDCRAYLAEPENELSKPLKCGYDPHTCTWEDWSANPLKEQAMKHYGFIKTTI